MQLQKLGMLGLVLVGLLFTNRVRADEPAHFPERVLDFPADRTVGLVYYWPGPIPETHEVMHLLGRGIKQTKSWPDRGPGRLHRHVRPNTQRVEAQGKVTIPAGHWCCLDLDDDAPPELAFLDHLSVNGVQCLRWLSVIPLKESAGPRIARLTGLRGLFFWTGNFSDKTLDSLVSLPNLEYLDLARVPFDDTGAARVAKCPKLKAFRVEHARLSSAGFASLAGLPLEFLAIPGAQKIDDGPLIRINHHAHLKTLDLSNTSITPKSLIVLASLPELQHMRLPSKDRNNYSWFRPELKAHFRKMDKLKTILPNPLDETYLKNLDKHPSKDIECAVSLAALEELELPELVSTAQLRRLCENKSWRSITMEINELNEDSIKCLATLPHLEVLEIEGSKIETPMMLNLMETISRIETLKALTIHSPLLDRKGLSQLARLPNLERLKLKRPKLSSEDYDELQHFHALKELSIDTPMANLESLVFLQHVPQLTALRMMSLRQELPLREFQRLKSLTKLQDLTYYTRVRDEMLPTLVELPELEHLILNQAYISDAGAKSLAACKSLEFFRIQRTSLTKVGVQMLGELPNRTVKYVSSTRLKKTDEINELQKRIPRLNWMIITE